MKICKRCSKEKEDNDFYKPQRVCKKCKIEDQKLYYENNKEIVKDYKKEYHQKNKNSISDKAKEYYINNSDKIKDRMKENYSLNKEDKIKYQKEYAKENKEKIAKYKKEHSKNNKGKIASYKKEHAEKNKEKIANYKKEYGEKNRDKINEYKRIYQKEKRLNDPIFKLKGIISRIIRNSLKCKGFTKSKRSCEILGCSIEDFKLYLEDRFINDMSWENYGTNWDIDHVIPLATALTEEDVINLNYYTNLQPLDSYINRFIKRDRLDY